MTVTTTVRLSEDLRDKLETEARESQLSFTVIIENALREHYGMGELGLATRVARLEKKMEELWRE